MVFGNMGTDSGSGVAFTRDAATGENVFYGEYLINAQGEDVVSGARTPEPIAQLAKENPKIYNQLEKVRKILEKHYRDMLDVEFTIQQGKLYMLQCRVGKRTAFAAINIAVDMVDENLISEKEAILRIEPDQLNQLLRPTFLAAEKERAALSQSLEGVRLGKTKLDDLKPALAAIAERCRLDRRQPRCAAPRNADSSSTGAADTGESGASTGNENDAMSLALERGQDRVTDALDQRRPMRLWSPAPESSKDCAASTERSLRLRPSSSAWPIPLSRWRCRARRRSSSRTCALIARAGILAPVSPSARIRESSVMPSSSGMARSATNNA
jgi:hypothetical protein